MKIISSSTNAIGSPALSRGAILWHDPRHVWLLCHDKRALFIASAVDRGVAVCQRGSSLLRATVDNIMISVILIASNTRRYSWRLVLVLLLLLLLVLLVISLFYVYSWWFLLIKLLIIGPRVWPPIARMGVWWRLITLCVLVVVVLPLVAIIVLHAAAEVFRKRISRVAGSWVVSIVGFSCMWVVS